MRIDCPHCGKRPSEEFTYLGDAAPKRPQYDPAAAPEDWFDYVYLRDNPKGRLAEYWHHSGGCRAWLVAERDTETHDIFSVVTAREWAKRPLPPCGGEPERGVGLATAVPGRPPSLALPRKGGGDKKGEGK